MLLELCGVKDLLFAGSRDFRSRDVFGADSWSQLLRHASTCDRG